MKTRKPNAKNDQKLAQQYACNARTIRRWRKEGAPLGNAKDMLAWLAARKTLPAGTLAWLEAEMATAEAKRLVPDPKLPRGSAAALQRLEEAEAHAYVGLQAALATGNAIQIKLAREGFLKTSDSLRRYDLVLDQHRRIIGETVSRAMVEKSLRWLAYTLRTQGKTMAAQLAAKLAGMDQTDVYAMIRDHWPEMILNSLATLGSLADTPRWIVDALTADLSNEFADPGEAIAARMEILRQANELALAERKATIEANNATWGKR